MKNSIKVITSGIATIAVSLFFFTACQKESINPAVTSESVTAQNDLKCGNNLLFAANAHMYGKSYEKWCAEWWKWNLQFDCAHTPLWDTDGSRENQNQSGPVYFLGGRRGNTLNVTIPHGKSILFPLITFYSEDPCSDNGTPNPGESIEHFLTRITKPSVDAMDQLSLTIDGQSINDLDDYKVMTDMFNFSANADLANCYDGCLSGTQQHFVAGGYMIMVKKLSPGTHTIHRVGGASSLFPFLHDITYNITQL